MKKTIIVVAILLASCTAKYKSDSVDVPSQALSSSGSAYVMMARDGSYGRRNYTGSGRTVSQNLHNAVLTHLSRSELSPAVESREQALEKARAMNATYLFEPIIINWEDRATQWSGRPDRISIRVNVWDVRMGKRIASSLERASSKWFTFGGDHPQDLVPRMMNTFANRVFQ